MKRMQMTPAVLAQSGLAAVAASLRLKDLPPAVQKTVQETLKGGQIRSISREVEKGVTQTAYTSKDGKKHEVPVRADGTETKD